jgi:hypothetical protein
MLQSVYRYGIDMGFEMPDAATAAINKVLTELVGEVPNEVRQELLGLIANPNDEVDFNALYQTLSERSYQNRFQVNSIQLLHLGSLLIAIQQYTLGKGNHLQFLQQTNAIEFIHGLLSQDAGLDFVNGILDVDSLERTAFQETAIEYGLAEDADTHDNESLKRRMTALFSILQINTHSVDKPLSKILAKRIDNKKIDIRFALSLIRNRYYKAFLKTMGGPADQQRTPDQNKSLLLMTQNFLTIKLANQAFRFINAQISYLLTHPEQITEVDPGTVFTHVYAKPQLPMPLGSLSLYPGAKYALSYARRTREEMERKFGNIFDQDLALGKLVFDIWQVVGSLQNFGNYRPFPEDGRGNRISRLVHQAMEALADLERSYGQFKRNRNHIKELTQKALESFMTVIEVADQMELLGYLLSPTTRFTLDAMVTRCRQALETTPTEELDAVEEEQQETSLADSLEMPLTSTDQTNSSKIQRVLRSRIPLINPLREPSHRNWLLDQTTRPASRSLKPRILPAVLDIPLGLYRVKNSGLVPTQDSKSGIQTALARWDEFLQNSKLQDETKFDVSLFAGGNELIYEAPTKRPYMIEKEGFLAYMTQARDNLEKFWEAALEYMEGSSPLQVGQALLPKYAEAEVMIYIQQVYNLAIPIVYPSGVKYSSDRYPTAQFDLDILVVPGVVACKINPDAIRDFIGRNKDYLDGLPGSSRRVYFYDPGNYSQIFTLSTAVDRISRNSNGGVFQNSQILLPAFFPQYLTRLGYPPSYTIGDAAIYKPLAEGLLGEMAKLRASYFGDLQSTEE